LNADAFATFAGCLESAPGPIAFWALFPDCVVSDNCPSAPALKACPWFIFHICSSALAGVAHNPLVQADLFVAAVDCLQEINDEVCFVISTFGIISRCVIPCIVREIEKVVEFIEYLFFVLSFGLVVGGTAFWSLAFLGFLPKFSFASFVFGAHAIGILVAH
jgi:hypothetical protein